MKTSVIRLATVAETFTSMKLTIGISKGAQAGDGLLAICVVRRQEGATIGTISFADAGQIYSIDNDLLWGRYFMLPSGADGNWAQNYEVTIKAQRKLKIGDEIDILMDANSANEAFVMLHSASFYKQ